MSVTFLTNEDKAMIDKRIDTLFDEMEKNLTRELFVDGDVIHSDDSDAMIKSIVLHGRTVSEERASKNLCSAGTVTFTQYTLIDIEEIPPGTYLASAVITSSDTDTDRSAIQYMNGDTMLKAQNFLRGERYADMIFTVDQPINKLRLYACGNGWNDSVGDTCTMADIMIEPAKGLKDNQVTEYEPYSAEKIIVGASPRVTIGDVEFSANTANLQPGDTLDFVTGELYRASSNATETINVSGRVYGLHGDLVVKTEGTVEVTYKKNSYYNERANNAMKLFGNKTRYFGIAAACGKGLSQCAEAVVQCAHCGLDGVEVDTRLAADGTVMIVHNEDISGVVNAPSGTLVSSKTLSELKSYKFLNDWIQYGYYDDVRMITLDECLKLCKKYGLMVTIDIKSDGYDGEHQTELLDNIIDVCITNGVQNSVVYTSLLSESRKYIRAKLPDAHIAIKGTISDTTFDEDLAKMVEVGGNVLMQVEGDPSEEILTPERLAQYHRYGAPVKDRDYIFTYDNIGVKKSGISYVFRFTTADGGATWAVDADDSNEAASAVTTLTLTNGVYTFVNYNLPPHLLSVASPAVFVMDDKLGQYVSTIQDYAGVKFKRVSGDAPSQITIRLDF